MSGFDDFAPFPAGRRPAPVDPFDPFGASYPDGERIFERVEPGQFLDQEQDPYIAPNWDIPETQWVTWGGEVTAPGDGTATKDTPYAEVARIEVSTPRLLWATLTVLAPAAQLVDVQVFQGLGRVDLQRDFLMNGGDLVELQLPARIVRVRTREEASSPAGVPIIVQAVLAPTFPDPDMRKGATLR